MLLRTVLFLSILLASGHLYAQHTYIHGKVFDYEGIAQADVYVKMLGTVIGDQTDSIGNYKIKVPTGPVRLVVQQAGYATYDSSFQAALAATDLQLDIKLQPAVSTKKRIIFRQPISKQSATVQQARYKLTLKRIPLASNYSFTNNGFSSAQAYQIIKQDWQQQVAVDGQLIPILDPGVSALFNNRQIASSLFSFSSIAQARTADKDANRSNQVLNIQHKQAQQKIALNVNGELGQAFISNKVSNIGRQTGNISAALNSELSEEKIFLSAAASYQAQNSNLDERFFQYANFNIPDNANIAWYRPSNTDIYNQAYQLFGAFEMRPSAYNKLRLSYSSSLHSDRIVQSNLQASPLYATQQKENINWKTSERNSLLRLEVENHFNRVVLDYTIDVAEQKYAIDERLIYNVKGHASTITPLSETDNADTNTLGSNDQASTLDQLTIEKSATTHQHASGNVNLTYFTNKGRTAFLKTGLKHSNRNRSYGSTKRRYTDSSWAEIDQAAYYFQDIFSDNSRLEQLGVDPRAVLDENIFSRAIAPTHSEQITAAYIMYEGQWSPRLSSSIGFRVEATSVDDIQTEEKLNYTQLFYNANFTYKLARKQQLHLAYYDAVDRPLYSLLNNIEQRPTNSQWPLIGSSSLNPSLSRNIKLSYHHYGRGNNQLGANLTARLIDKPVANTLNFGYATNNRISARNGLVNLNKGQAIGIELYANQHLGFIHESLQIVRINVSYNHNYTKTQHEDTRIDELPLPNIPRQSISFSLEYQHPAQRFQLAAIGNFEGKTLASIIDSQAIYRKPNFNLNLHAAARLGQSAMVYAQLTNATNTLIKYAIYQNQDSYFVSSQQYGSIGSIGLRWAFSKTKKSKHHD